jgi:hypothetical protein
MAPSAIDTPMSGQGRLEQVVNPPKLYQVREAHFERYLEPQPDGYRKARARSSGDTAIVIDNGMSFILLEPFLARRLLIYGFRVLSYSSRMVIRKCPTLQHTPHHGQIPGAKTRKDVRICRIGCLCRYHSSWSYEICFRSWDWNC